MQTIINGVLVNYTIVGEVDKPCLVLLHGWLDSLQTFNQLAEELSDDYQFVMLDWPGFGQSSPPPNDADLIWYSNILTLFIQKQGINPVAYIGHSFGARVLLYLSGTDSFIKAQSTARLILIAGAGITSSSTAKTMLRMLAKPVSLLRYCMRQTAYEKLRTIVYKFIGSDYAISGHISGVYTNIIGFDLRSHAQNITHQTLLIYGEHDTSTPVAYGWQFANIIKNAELKVVPQAGHFVHQTHTSTVALLIRKFL